MGGLWRGVLVAALNVNISFCSGAFADLPFPWSAVYSPKVHGLLHSLRPSPNDQPHNGCNRVFPPNEQ